MEKRIDYFEVDPTAIKGMLELEKHTHASGIEPSLLELVKTRVSQINGCAYCLDMHTIDARKAGETEQRLYTLSTWKETPFFTDRERAALAWAESITLVSENDVPNALYEATLQHFNEKELVALTMAIIAINGWNRLAIAFRKAPGSYNP